MILLWLILIPLIAGVLAWAAARWSASAARWIALIAVLIDFVLDVVAVDRQFPRGPSYLVRTGRLGVDSAVRHPLSPRRRRPEPFAADAHVFPGHRVCAGVLD